MSRSRASQAAAVTVGVVHGFNGSHKTVCTQSKTTLAHLLRALVQVRR